MDKDILDFLKQLSDNNNKEWMDANKAWYLNIKASFLEKVTYLLKEMTELEPGLATLKPKDCVFRQNRDIRFSANKAPYKSNMAAYFSVGGKKSFGPGYYVHIEPGKSFLAGGIWMPPSDILKKIRKEIDYTGNDLIQIIHEPGFKSFFGDLEGEKLKTSPRDYEADHPHIELLKLKSFIVSRPLEDKDIQSGDYVKLALKAFEQMKPFQDYLTRAVEDVESGEGLLA